MTPAELKRFAGQYDLGSAGSVTIKAGEDHLLVHPAGSENPLRFLPQSAHEFFRESDGDLITFDIEEGEVRGFTVFGIEAARVEDQALDGDTHD